MKKSALFLVSFFAAAAAMIAFIGCETESAASAQIDISPASATLTASNPTLVLSASGGWSYTWSVSDYSIGSLDKYSGSSVTYTATAFRTNACQTITVSASGMTNSAGTTATATITQK